MYSRFKIALFQDLKSVAASKIKMRLSFSKTQNADLFYSFDYMSNQPNSQWYVSSEQFVTRK